MTEIDRRAHEIVEELRADIDFEIDDVISKIVRGLPDDYFRILARGEQMKHLKALLALGVCNVDQEIMMQSDDEKFIAVVARKNFPGLLAKILKRLPNQRELVGAKIFTAKDQQFIIDLFEFKMESSPEAVSQIELLQLQEKIESVAKRTGHSIEDIGQFASQYDPNSPVFEDENYLVAQFSAYQLVATTDQVSVNIDQNIGTTSQQITVASGSVKAFDVFEKTAGYLAERSCDIEQAVLNDFACPSGKRASIASFRLSSAAHLEQTDCSDGLAKFLQ